MGVLMSLESACCGTGVWLPMPDSLTKELDMTFIVLASGRGVALSSKPFLRAAGVLMPPFSRPLTCRVRLVVALFIIGVNSGLAVGLCRVARGARAGVRVPFAALKRLSRPAGAWNDSSSVKSMPVWLMRVWSPRSVRGVSRKCAMVGLSARLVLSHERERNGRSAQCAASVVEANCTSVLLPKVNKHTETHKVVRATHDAAVLTRERKAHPVTHAIAKAARHARLQRPRAASRSNLRIHLFIPSQLQPPPAPPPMEGPKDDFKWFGEGFDGFPKRLPEDVVEYTVFIVDAHLSQVQIRERLQAFQRALTALEKKFLKEYIWQREPIKLDLVHENGRWFLKGVTNYGDSVADEWLIVFFLRELSKEFKDAWIRIYDTDGEFLLIEAANALPNWLNPEISENRVWINSHRLLVIPLSKQQEPAPLDLTQALLIIRETPARPQHYPKIEKEAFHRLNGYPEAIATNQHHATLPLPRKVAYILHLKPSYVAPAVEAFYLRDPIALRLLDSKKSSTPLIFPPQDFVQVSTRFTKVLYAQLLGQNWDPPAAYGDALDQLKQLGNAPEKAEVALKLAAGLEMLVRHEIYADKTATREIHLLLEDLTSDQDALPTDTEISSWPKREDDEAWLNIDFTEFERELAGKGSKNGFGDKDAEANLKKMVERFNNFLHDEEAGLDGAHGFDPMDQDDDSDTAGRGWDDPEDSDSAAAPSDHASNKEQSDDEDDEDDDDEDDKDDEDADADAEYAEYEKAYEKFMMLSAAEKAILTDDARELALAEEADREEDEEIQKLSEMMEAELFGHGAFDVKREGAKKKQPAKSQGSAPMMPASGKGKGKAPVEDTSEDESEDGQVLDDDYNLAENMLKAFKGQVGMAGPAGNLMGLMGVQFPPDADDERESRAKGKAPVR